MAKPQILILGAGIMQGPAIRAAQEMGFEVTAADADPSAPCVSLASRFAQVDLKDRKGIEALARSLMEDGGLSGIMTAGTDFPATVAWAAQQLNLPGIPYETALNASDKDRMRHCFKKAGLPSPDFAVITKPEWDAELFPPFPLVLKPVDNMGARGCRRVDTKEEFVAAAKDALAFSRSGRAIVEEYMEGPEFSIDALVYQGEITMCGIADRHIFFPPYFIEMGHTMPSNEDPAHIRALLETFSQGVKALGIDNGAAKGDIKLTKRGPMIGEIAARLSGGYMSGWTYPYSSGVMPVRGAIEIAVGRKPSKLTHEWSQTAAERAFISIPGIVSSIVGVENARIMPHVRDVFVSAKAGKAVNFPENNVMKCGNVISVAERREDAVLSAKRASRSILIRLQAPNEASEAFLAVNEDAQHGSFPPPAFPLDEKLVSALNALEPDSIQRGTNTGKSPVLLDFPQLCESELTDYMGRSVGECLDAVRLLSGFELPLVKPGTAFEDNPVLGRQFWQAFVRGGYQGAVYFIDCLVGGNHG